MGFISASKEIESWQRTRTAMAESSDLKHLLLPFAYDGFYTFSRSSSRSESALLLKVEVGRGHGGHIQINARNQLAEKLVRTLEEAVEKGVMESFPVLEGSQICYVLAGEHASERRLNRIPLDSMERRYGVTMNPHQRRFLRQLLKV